jgi:tripartite-type tricarboxylate transporter receptor subunit TctC
MKLPRRNFLRLAAGAAALPTLSHIARAQAYPTRPIRIVVTFPPGGASDTLARPVAQWLQERLGQPFVIDNRPGAGGTIGTEAVVRASPDGYTLLWIGGNHTVNATLYDKLSFNFVHDIAPIGSVSREAMVMVVNPSFPAKTVPEFIAYAKANPGKINMASAGVGASSHVAAELFKMMTGVNMLHVPYRGSPAALTDVLGGQVQVYFAIVASAVAYIRAGTLRPLAVTGRMRLEILPDIPTVGEFVPGYEATISQGIGAPKNIPVEIIDKLNKGINAGLADPTMKMRLSDLGVTAFAGSPADFGKLIAEETEKWAKVIRAANIKV